MKIFLDDDYIYYMMKHKGTKLIVDAKVLIARIEDVSLNPSEAARDKRIADIELNTRKDGMIEITARGGSNDFLIGHKEVDDD